jgi:predicted  nucleic acid-binding Zn-ribbon protein
MTGENILQTLQRIATTAYRVDTLAEEVAELRKVVETGFGQLNDQMADVRERLARLEAARDADRAQIQANIAQFKAEVERAELRLRQLPPEQS